MFFKMKRQDNPENSLADGKKFKRVLMCKSNEPGADPASNVKERGDYCKIG